MEKSAYPLERRKEKKEINMRKVTRTIVQPVMRFMKDGKEVMFVGSITTPAAAETIASSSGIKDYEFYYGVFTAEMSEKDFIARATMKQKDFAKFDSEQAARDSYSRSKTK